MFALCIVPPVNRPGPSVLPPPNLPASILFLQLLIIIFMRRTLVVKEMLWQE